jgi:competence protein ComEC
MPTVVATDVRNTPALFWLTGGLLAGQTAAAVTAGPWWTVSALIGALVVFMIGVRWRPSVLRPAVAAALLAAALGHWQVDRVLRPRFGPHHLQQTVGQRLVLRGYVVERPARRPGKTRLVVEAAAIRRGAEWQPASGRVMVTLLRATQPWRRGDGVEAILALRRPRNFGNPGEFDFEAYLARRGIYVTGFAASDMSWQRQPVAEGWAAGIERWRDAVTRSIETTLDPTTASITAALLVGKAIPLAPDVRERYVRAGVSHVLSISGLHVGLVAGAAYAAMRWLFARSERVLLYANVPKLATTASLAPLVLYGAIAGDNVATIRAEIMGVLVVSALLLDRSRDWLTPLAAAALAINLYWPGALFEIGFQLSFVAVLAIVLGMRRVSAWWVAWEESRLIRLRGAQWRWLRWLVLSEAVTVCATVGTAPLTAWHFNQLSLIAVLANPLVVPLLGLLGVGIGLFATAAVVVAPAAAPPLFRCVGLVVGVADALVDLCAAVPGASVRVVTPSLLELALLYGALVALLIPRRKLRRVVLAFCVTGLVIDAGYWVAPRRDLQITFVSVGQGDCAVVEFPGSVVMVVDGGGLFGDFDVGRQVVAPFLWRRKITQVDLLALSHADFDHFGGLAFLAEAFAPDALWWNGVRGRGVRFAALERALHDNRVQLQAVRSGTRRIIGGVEVRVLHPDAGGGSDNDRSLTLQLRFGATTVLLPGDLEAAGERALVAAHGGALHSTILKVPHHGSRTSSTAALLDATAPRLAVISAGADNRFGFPHATVLDAYRTRGTVVLRTDRDGAVTLRITADGRIDIRTGRPRATHL